MFRFPRVQRNPAVARSRALRSRRGIAAPRWPRGVGGGRVAPPASTVSHRVNFLSELVFVKRLGFLQVLLVVDLVGPGTKGLCSPGSVWRVHGAVASLLLLFLLQEELLQR